MVAIRRPARIHQPPRLAVLSAPTQSLRKRAAMAMARASRVSLGRAKVILRAKTSLSARAPALRTPTVGHASLATSARASASLARSASTAPPRSAQTGRCSSARLIFATRAVARLAATPKTIAPLRSSVTASNACRARLQLTSVATAAVWRVRPVRRPVGLACCLRFGSRGGAPRPAPARGLDARCAANARD